MSNEIIKVLDYLGEKFGLAVDWTQENIMPYLEDLATRMIKLNIIEDIIGIVIWGILFLGVVIGGIVIINQYGKCVKAIKHEGDNIYWNKRIPSYSDPYVEVTVFGAASLFAMACILFASTFGLGICIAELIKWIYIPELQIAEEVSYLIQTI